MWGEGQAPEEIAGTVKILMKSKEENTMSEHNITIRLEEEADYRETENLTR